MFHYTDAQGFKAICSQINWLFKKYDPKGPHPEGAYFTNLHPSTLKLAKKLRLPAQKLEWLFQFREAVGLVPIDHGKGRGQYVFYSPIDYVVEPSRQQFRGVSDQYWENMS